MDCTVTGTNLPLTAFNADEWKEVLDARKQHHELKSKTEELSRAGIASVAIESQEVRPDAVKTPAQRMVNASAAERLRRGPIPRLPIDDYKVIYRPNAGVSMAAFTERELRAALLDSSGLTESNTQGDLTRTNLLKNVFTMSTACQERVIKYAQIRQITLRGKKIEIQAYIAPPDRAIQGIIYRAHNGESPQEILRELRRSNPLVPIVQARDMGRTSKSVLIHFMSDRLPESVKFFGSVFAIYPFRPKVEACTNCRRIGHRRDVCPEPTRSHCPDCGQQHPVDHQCSPTCIVCGGDHRTGDRLCRRKYQRGSAQRTRTPRPPQRHMTPELQLDQASFPPLTPEAGNDQTRSKSPRRDVPTGWPPARQALQQVSWADSVSHRSSTRSDPRDLYYQGTIEQLTKENQDLKQQMSLILERLNALTHSKSAPPVMRDDPAETHDPVTANSSDRSETDQPPAEDCPPRKKRVLADSSDVSDTSAQALSEHINKVEQRVDLGFTQIAERFARMEQVISDLTSKLLPPAPTSSSSPPHHGPSPL
ncbi:hypothetical protein HPB50_006429 [Hyalomma asiaticum]|uniref:Uncharacterized protein n=1 Tax=Hyalomma asiaticum TaxID=266040 RepID=A0ACB7S4K9_HYAAI|nr:hypothetical protein HPB50_006429 [Hyalomma asiaticum]